MTKFPAEKRTFTRSQTVACLTPNEDCLGLRSYGQGPLKAPPFPIQASRLVSWVPKRTNPALYALALTQTFGVL